MSLQELRPVKQEITRIIFGYFILQIIGKFSRVIQDILKF